MNTEKVIKIAGMTATAIGVAAQVVSAALDEKKLDIKIAKEVAKQIKK